MEQLSDLSSKEEATLLDQYAGEPLIRAMLAIDFFIRRAARRFLGTDLPTEAD
jgi:hypothetical protein